MLDTLVTAWPVTLQQRSDEPLSIGSLPLAASARAGITAVVGDNPWMLDADGLVVPVGLQGEIGSRGVAFGAALAQVEGAPSMLSLVGARGTAFPNQPVLLRPYELARVADAGRTAIRCIILVTAQEAVVGRDARATVASVVVVTQGSMRLAINEGVRRLVFPVLGVGNDQLQSRAVVPAFVRAIRDSLADGPAIEVIILVPDELVAQDVREADIEVVPAEAFKTVAPSVVEGAMTSEPERLSASSPDPVTATFEQESIGSDHWTTTDTLGYAAYADAIARSIQHPATAPPLTIGIKAPWGAGKTSLMRMIVDRLEWPTPGDPRRLDGKRRSIRLSGPSNDVVTNRTVLDEVKSSERGSVVLGDVGTMRADPDEKLNDDEERRWRPTVWFNPWMYETGDQVWAGLAHEIIDQTSARMDRGERERFWLRLNLARADGNAIRRKVYGVVVDRVLPGAVRVLVAASTLVALLAMNQKRLVGPALAVISPVGLAWFEIARRGVLSKPVSGNLATLVKPATSASTGTGDVVRGAYEQLIRAPDYEGQSGFFYLVRTDMQRVLDLVATKERPLVVFVDDLDRCSPRTVVQVIEAINLFLAGQFPNAVFVIAMDPEMVAAHIEAAYSDLEEKLKKRHKELDLGWRFLEKIVQLPLTLPTMQRERASMFASSLFVTEPASAPSPATAPPSPSETDVQQAEQVLQDASLSEVVQHPAAVLSDAGEAPSAAVAKEATRRVLERKLSRADPDVQAAIAYSAEFLDPNPREIKRFFNLFRFFVMIHTERVLSGLPTLGSLDDIAKLATLSIRWPALTTVLVEPTSVAEKTVFELLEVPPPTSAKDGESPEEAVDRGLRSQLEDAGLSDDTVERLLSPELLELLRAKPTVGSAVRGWL